VDPRDLAIVGAGRVGTALAVLLQRSGHRVVAVSGRDASRKRAARHLREVPFVPMLEAARRAEVVLVGVPDDRILPVCETLASHGAFRGGQWVAHLSGSQPLEVLSPARAAGAGLLSVHPLQTFPDVQAALARIPGAAMAVTAEDDEGYALGEGIAAGAGGRSFRLADERKPLYHAAAVFCSNYLAVVEGIAEGLFARAGIEDPLAAFAPLAEATFANVMERGPAGALTGPVSRGDAGTVRRNLEALGAEAPEAVAAYVALAGAAARLATDAGRLAPEARAEVEEVLAAWR